MVRSLPAMAHIMLTVQIGRLLNYGRLNEERKRYVHHYTYRSRYIGTSARSARANR